MARISDQRVRQFWDPEHAVSGALNEFAKQTSSEPRPDCCVQKGIYWDEAILYATHAHWKDHGRVMKAIPSLETALGELH